MIKGYSDIMRHLLYRSESPLIPLQEEIDFLKNYIELHKMRYHKQITVDFKCEVDENRKVVPLLFIILLENSFKHCIENLIENEKNSLNY